MTTLQRRSPILPPNYGKQEVKDAIDILEKSPRIPNKTPTSSSADGYEGEIAADGTYLYVYRGGSWKRATLSSF